MICKMITVLKSMKRAVHDAVAAASRRALRQVPVAVSANRMPFGLRGLLCAGVVLFVCMVTAHGFHARMELSPEIIRMGESADWVITIEGVDRGEPPDMPEIPGLRISGPTIEQSFSMSLSGGQREHTRSISYTYRIFPLEPGTYTIGPLSYTHDGQTVDLGERELQVVMPRGENGERQARDLSDLVFAEIKTSRDRVFVNQAFTLTFYIYSRDVNMGRDISLSEMPESGVRMEPFQELRPTREAVRGDVYDVRRYQTQIRPLTSGTLRYDPELTIQLLVPRSERQNSFFRAFGGGMEAHPVKVVPEPVEVHVRSLPEAERPDDFTGGVGRFSFTMDVNPKEARVGDPISLTMVIEGEGNLDTLNAPSITENGLFRVYAPRVMESALDRAGHRGRRTFEQVIIPRTAEVRKVPALTFSYFDPEDETYKGITRGPVELDLQGDAPDVSRQVRSADRAAERSTRIVGEDIAYLQPAPATWHNVEVCPWFLRWPFLALQGVPLMILLAVYLWARRRRALEQNVALARRYRAPRVARAGLRRAEKALAQEDEEAFYDGLWNSLTSYFGDRLNLPSGSVTSEEVGQAMRKQGLDPKQMEALDHCFAACEQRRFARIGSDPHQMRTRLNEFRGLLKACERVKS